MLISRHCSWIANSEDGLPGELSPGSSWTTHVIRPPRRHRSSAVSRPADARVAQAIDVMNANVADPVPLAAIAGMVGLSIRQLDRLFIAATGKSGSRTYLAIRIDRALELLSQSTWSVTEIAHATGFVDGAHPGKDAEKVRGSDPARDQVQGRQQASRGFGQPVGSPPASTLRARCMNLIVRRELRLHRRPSGQACRIMADLTEHCVFAALCWPNQSTVPRSAVPYWTRRYTAPDRLRRSKRPSRCRSRQLTVSRLTGFRFFSSLVASNSLP